MLMVLSPRLYDLIERIVQDEDDVVAIYAALDGKQMCMLNDLERKLYALRKALVRDMIRTEKDRENKKRKSP